MAWPIARWKTCSYAWHDSLSRDMRSRATPYRRSWTATRKRQLTIGRAVPIAAVSGDRDWKLKRLAHWSVIWVLSVKFRQYQGLDDWHWPCCIILAVRWLWCTVEPVLKDYPIGHTNVVFQDKWSLVTGSVYIKCRTFCQEYLVL